MSEGRRDFKTSWITKILIPTKSVNILVLKINPADSLSSQLCHLGTWSCRWSEFKSWLTLFFSPLEYFNITNLVLWSLFYQRPASLKKKFINCNQADFNQLCVFFCHSIVTFIIYEAVNSMFFLIFLSALFILLSLLMHVNILLSEFPFNFIVNTISSSLPRTTNEDNAAIKKFCNVNESSSTQSLVSIQGFFNTA